MEVCVEEDEIDVTFQVLEALQEQWLTLLLCLSTFNLKNETQKHWWYGLQKTWLLIELWLKWIANRVLVVSGHEMLTVRHPVSFYVNCPTTEVSNSVFRGSKQQFHPQRVHICSNTRDQSEHHNPKSQAKTVNSSQPPKDVSGVCICAMQRETA